jgi:site-specific DNA-cytosine methylase
MSLTAIGYLVGGGSMSLGIERAGFTIKHILETPAYMSLACTWGLNRLDIPPIMREVNYLDDVFTRLSKVDLIYGNPPCGGVSSMGGNAIARDRTNASMRHWIRMVVQGTPRAILMESGYQLDTPRYQPLLADLVSVLERAGYFWWTWQIKSWQVGTPQVRKRMFLCASRYLEESNIHLLELKDLPDQPRNLGLTACEALGHLVGVSPVHGIKSTVIDRLGRVLTAHTYDPKGWKMYPHAGMARRFLQSRQFRTYLTPRQHQYYVNYLNNAKTLGVRERAQYSLDIMTPKLWAECPPELNQSQTFKNMVMVAPNEVAPTVIGEWRYLHWEDDRLLTMRELATLMGYPDDWQFHAPDPKIIARGVPINNAYWAALRLRKLGGLDG